MVLSSKLQKMIQNAIPDKSASAELIAAIAAEVGQATHVANIATADATDLASAEALSNANKAKINEILAAMQAASQMA